MVRFKYLNEHINRISNDLANAFQQTRKDAIKAKKITSKIIILSSGLRMERGVGYKKIDVI